ncbi:MAG: hypothetical protein K6G12_05250 [Lachnospiraceae bacterium]|nr:hypothetical protein [Lachnospiraceae bacterium]
MEYTLLGTDEIESIKDFLSENDYAGFINNAGRYALCAIENDKLYGVGIFDANKTATIRDVIVTDDKRGNLEAEIIRKIVMTCDGLKCDAVVMDVYDEDEPDLYDELLKAEGFVYVSGAVIYSFDLKDLKGNYFLDKAKPGSNIIPLRRTTEQMRRVFSNELKNAGAYDHFMDRVHNPKMSVVCVEDDMIKGCALVDDLKDEYGFELAYLYLNKNSSPTHMIEMLAAARDNVDAVYNGADAVGYITAMNDKSESLVDMIIPDARVEDHINRYVRVVQSD